MRNKLIVISIISLLFLTQIAFGKNIEKSIESIEEKIVKNNIETELPSYFSWNDIDGEDFTTPVRAQQPYASCETFAYVAALETMVQWKVGYPFGCDLSEAHLYFWSGGNRDWGSYPENDTNFLVKYGVPDEACWPYPGYLEEPVVFPKNTTCPNWRNRTVQIKNWSYLPPNNINAIKEALVNNGPVPSHLNVYEDFGRYKGGIYRHTWGESQGLHLVCIMGYKDDPSISSGGYWIVKNSWGTHLKSGKPWGENGWFRIAYGEASIEEMPVLFEEVYGQFPILYVDDDNVDGPWDGSEKQPYQKISDAIKNCYEGWTVFVKNGTYNENVIINKTINLDGENKEKTIIDGNGKDIVIYVQAKEVRISGLTVQNSGKKRLNSGIRTLSLDSNLTVKDCIIKNNDVGIYLNCIDGDTYKKSGNTITNNTIVNNKVGIFTMWANNNEIKGNTICNNTLHGIEMESSRTSIIKNNTICNNKAKGIYLHGACDFNQILENNIIDNSYGLLIKETKRCKIKDNNFINNTEQAGFLKSRCNLWMHNYWSDWNKILPRPIKGTINLGNLPWFNFDLQPSAKII